MHNVSWLSTNAFQDFSFTSKQTNQSRVTTRAWRLWERTFCPSSPSTPTSVFSLTSDLTACLAAMVFAFGLGSCFVSVLDWKGRSSKADYHDCYPEEIILVPRDRTGKDETRFVAWHCDHFADICLHVVWGIFFGPSIVKCKFWAHLSRHLIVRQNITCP